MSTTQELLDDIDARYRNTYTPTQKVIWMNQVLKQIFQSVRHESTPFYFLTLANQPFYPLPDDCDPYNIEQVMLQVDNDKKEFLRLEFKRKDEDADDAERFYSILERNLFLHPVPDIETEGRKVYVYYKKRPKDISSTNLSETPDIEEDFEELLIFGVLEKIAGARKDVNMKNNYSADFEILFRRYKDTYKNTEPDFVRTRDVLPRRGRNGRTVANRTVGNS